jgi:hypothetical protein
MIPDRRARLSGAVPNNRKRPAMIAASLPLAAHHSFSAEFDGTREVRPTGEVAEVEHELERAQRDDRRRHASIRRVERERHALSRRHMQSIAVVRITKQSCRADSLHLAT